MNSLLGLSLCFFMVLVTESLSLKPLLRAPVGNRILLSPATVGERHSNLFLVRGGATEQNKNGGIKSALDPSLITGALVAMGKFYSSSLESSPVLTKSATVRILHIMDATCFGLPIYSFVLGTGCCISDLFYCSLSTTYIALTTQGHGTICNFGPNGAGFGDTATAQQVRWSSVI